MNKKVDVDGDGKRGKDYDSVKKTILDKEEKKETNGN